MQTKAAASNPAALTVSHVVTTTEVRTAFMRFPEGTALEVVEVTEAGVVVKSDFGATCLMAADQVRAATVKPVLTLPDRPAITGHVGIYHVPAHVKTQTYEVAAWYALLAVPAQSVDLGVTAGGYLCASGTVEALITERHTPTLYGGLRVGSQGTAYPNEPTMTTLHVNFGDLHTAALEGRAVLSEVGRAWCEYHHASRAAIEGYALAVRDWKAHNKIRY